MKTFCALLISLCGMAAAPLLAQGPPPAFDPQQLEQMVASIALYPDPLLAQILTASTFSDQIPDADGWARAHSYLTGDALARAINEDNLPWDPSVIALLPFPAVLDRMAGDRAWTEDLGNAVLADRVAVMDAVQDQRQRAYNYGYLRSGPQYRVTTAPGDIEIIPVNPLAIYVPYYAIRMLCSSARARDSLWAGRSLSARGFSSTRSRPGAGEGSASAGARTRSSSTTGRGSERG